MKTRVAVLVLLVAVVVLAFAIVKLPLSRPARPAKPVGPQPLPLPPTDAKGVVSDYVKALESKDLRAAYAHLSKSSQQAHSYDEFVAMAEKSGSPSYDVAAAVEEPGKSGRITVTVPLLEDLAKAEFTMVAEDGTWKIVFIGGVPSFPYGE